jgi:hypothetical protein
LRVCLTNSRFPWEALQTLFLNLTQPGNFIPRVALVCVLWFFNLIRKKTMTQTKTNTSVRVSLSSRINFKFFSFRDFSSRKEAFEEGYLVDVSALSSTFKVPVAMTREVWELYVAVNDNDLFNQQSRVVSLLTQAKEAVKHTPAHATEAFFEVKQFPGSSSSYLNKLRLWVVVSLGDQSEPVLTIMLDTQHAEAR